jgi:hypothetical protein
MNSRWGVLVAASLVAFASLVIMWQFLHYDDVAALREWVARGQSGGKPGEISSSLFQSYIRGKQLAEISDIVKRDQIIVQAAGLCRYVDLVLPKDARVFMTDMNGPTNYSRIMYYWWMTYYLFPREVGTSLDHVTRITKDSLLGRTSKSDQEILTNGYDAIVDFPPHETLTLRLLRPLREFPLKEPVNPAWFSSNTDTVIAFLLPLLTALAGMWLFRFLFLSLSEQMPLLEQLACGLGLGMMAVAALTLGIKLCGFSGRGLIFSVTAVGGIAEIWRDRKAYLTGIIDGYWKMVRSPVAIAVFVAGSLVFLVLFRLAGLQGLTEQDAVMAWSLKAKIIHLYTGSEIVQWFSNPRLAHAHLDYPTLVPSLHAATYDSLGHVDEFVTKFWPIWMLLFLIGALASLNRRSKGWFHAPCFFLLALLLLPATQQYVQWEGGTMPMVFFTVMGFVQCAFWLVGKDRTRLTLGLTLLFGAAMAKFEGFIFLALVGSWMLLLPSARPSLKPSPRLWQVLAFCFLAALPFVCLRVRIPVLHFESGWADYALHNPGTTLSNCPWIFMILLARLFVNPDFADWNGEGGQLHWIGKWDGLSSLYNPSTLGLAWLSLFMTVALWFAVPARRQVVVWTLAMLVSALVVFSVVFASLFNVTNLVSVIAYTTNHIAGRYLLPVLLAWFATIMTLFFADVPSSASTPGTGATVPYPPASVSSPVGVKTDPETSKKQQDKQQPPN